MPFEQLNGIDFHFEEYGSGPPVVFAHGGGGTHISWFQQIPYFSKRYRCIVIDHRGFGLSSDPQGEGGRRFVDDLEILLDRLGIERTALVAQSMGGRTALGYAVRHPERVAALVMCDTVGDPDWPDLQQRRAELQAQHAATPALDRAFAADFAERNPEMALLLRLNFFTLPRPRDTVELGRGERGQTNRSGSSGYGKAEIARLPVPTLFLVGEDDRLAFPELVRQMHSIVPGSEYIEVEGSGHSIYWEDPTRFNELVGAFLAKHSWPAVSSGRARTHE